MKKAVHFGAGNIGRGFIGILLERAGYAVTFVDVNDTIVNALQARGRYTVEIADGSGDSLTVTGVTAIDGRNRELVAATVADADLVTTAIGVNVLPVIAGPIADGIRLRMNQVEHKGTLAIIACENTIGGSTQLRNHVFTHLSESDKEQVELGHIAVFPDAAVDRIVPLQQHEDPLHVLVEPFFEWVVDRSALPSSHEVIDGVHYVDDLTPYIERKLFTVNTGHCCTAYWGYAAGYATIQQAIADPTIAARVRGVLSETGDVITTIYPEFNRADHDAYISKILERFRNPYLVDEVIRVGRSPKRKLSAADRLIRPASLALEHGLSVNHLVDAIVAALRYDEASDEEAVDIQKLIKDRGIDAAVTELTGLAVHSDLHRAIVQAFLARGANV